MAQPTPPPYVDVTGIARTDMKINKQETIAEYDGNARPGELVVDLTTYNLYIGNADGNLNGFSGGGGTNYANANLVSYLNTGLAGNIIPSANNVYSLGSPTRQWASIYVGANTLYLGATAVSSDGTGLVVGGEAVITANTPISGNVEADYFIGDGSLLTNLPAGNYSNSNVAAYLPTYSGNVTTITATGTIYAVGNIAGNVFIGNGSQLTGIVSSSALSNTNANVSNTNSNVANLTTSLANTDSNVSNLSTSLTSTNSNVSNTNSNVSNLSTSLTSTNSNVSNTNSNVSNLSTSLTSTNSNVSNTNSNVSNVASNVTTLQGQVYTNSNTATFLAAFGSNTITTTGNISVGTLAVTADATITGNLTVNGTTTTVNSNTVTINDKFINVANNASTSTLADGGGLGVGPVGTEYATLAFNNTNTSWDTNISVSVTGNVFASGVISATGNVRGGNLNTAGDVIATANVAGGNITTGGVVTATGNVQGANVLTGGLISATATITGGNVETAGFVTATGNVQGGNLVTAGQVSATGNITGGNITTAGAVSITGTMDIVGNITSGNILPAANNVYSLGSPDMLWANLYVSSNTIYFGTTPVSVSDAGMVVNGSDVVTAGTPTTGNISADYFIGNLQLTANASITSTGNESIHINSADNVYIRGFDPADASATEGGDINLLAGNGSNADNTGNALAGTGGDVNITGGEGGYANGIYQGGIGGRIIIDGGVGVSAVEDVGNSIYTAASEGGDIVITGGAAGSNLGNASLGASGGALTLSGGTGTGLYQFGAVLIQGSQVQIQTEGIFWNFNHNGNLTLPSTANIKGNTVSLLAANALSIQSDAAVNVQSNVSNITLGVLNANAESFNFTFDNTGNLTVPNNINAPANTITSINGFSFDGGSVSVTGIVRGLVLRTEPSLVADLPPAGAANISGAGSRSFVTDADTRTWGNTAVGGGANAVPVWSDGTDWFIG